MTGPLEAQVYGRLLRLRGFETMYDKPIRVVVVSPSDVLPAREAATRVIAETSRIFLLQGRRQLVCWRWETDAHPGFHEHGPQGLIDELMQIQDADVVVGIFWKRFGTPTTTHGSGTEHELRRAIDARRARGRPQVMVYFCSAPAMPSLAELDQWRRVLEFKEEFPADGLWWSYIDAGEFEHIFRDHLQTYLITAAGRGEPGVAVTPPSLLDPPAPHDAVARRQFWSTLDAALQAHPIVVLGGLSGSGKTYGAASYLRNGLGSQRYSRVYWHDPAPGESIDSLLAVLAQAMTLVGESTLPRCKALAAQLRSQNALLVIDNFHTVDHASYSLLQSAMLMIGSPCRLLLLSQSYVNGYGAEQNPHHLHLGGMSFEEADSLFRCKRVEVDRAIVMEVLEKTGGLPFAVALFCLLVLDFGHEPRDLLSGTMESATRIRAWFDRILESLDPDSRALLSHLAVLDIPFNVGVVRVLGNGLQLAEAERCFESLQHQFLISRHTPFRWIVHELLRVLARPMLDDQAISAVHHMLGHHFLRGLPRRTNVVLSDEQFLAKVRAFRHLARASDDRALALAVLDELASTAKIRGHYRLFLELSASVIGEPGGVRPWILYHRGHCALILGYPMHARRLIEPLLYHPAVIAEPTARLSLSRLYAEALRSLNQIDDALMVLSEAIRATVPTMRGSLPYRHAMSVMSLLLAQTGSHAEARKIADRLLRESLRRHDHRGSGVALACLGTSQLIDGSIEKAGRSFSLSTKCFSRVGDRRGTTWSLSSVGECNLLLGDMQAAESNLRVAAAIAAEIGECSADLRERIDRMLSRSPPPPESIAALLRDEQERIRRHTSIRLPYGDH